MVGFFLFMFGYIAGVTTLIVVVCCVAAGDYDRMEERWKDEQNNESHL